MHLTFLHLNFLIWKSYTTFCLGRKRTYYLFVAMLNIICCKWHWKTKQKSIWHCNCEGKWPKLWNLELSATAYSTGALFTCTKFVLPINCINEHVGKIKFHVVSTGSQEILQRNGMELPTVSLEEYLRLVYWISKNNDNWGRQNYTERGSHHTDWTTHKKQLHFRHFNTNRNFIQKESKVAPKRVSDDFQLVWKIFYDYRRCPETTKHF